MIITHSRLSLQFPFGGLNYPAVRVLMSILDDTPDYNDTSWAHVSEEGMNSSVL